MKRCAFCGQEDHDEAILCKHCMRSFAAGARLRTSAGAAKSLWWSLIAIIVVAGIAGAVMWPDMMNPVASPTELPRQPVSPVDVAPRSETAADKSAPPAPANSRTSSRETRAGQEEAARSSPTGRRTQDDRLAARQQKSPAAVSTPPDERARPAQQNVAPTETGGAISEAAPARPLRVGGDIKPPRKIRDVPPVYPAIAQAARVQGVVIVEATIDPAGRVQEARVLRSIPLLDAAALDAIKQWQYEPTLVNGVPSAVIMTVTVNFSLQ
jgi:TonB family protein